MIHDEFMSDRPRVSAILTTHQRPRLAERALQSILEQTHVPREIIVVEDGGDSGISRSVANLNRTDVKYVAHAVTRGLAAARNTGLRIASCELVAFLDDDDVWLPTRLEEQVRRYCEIPRDEKTRIGAIQVGCKVLDSRGREIGVNLPINQGSLRESIMQFGAATPSSCFLFVREALLRVNGFDERLISGIDHDIWMKLAVAGYWNEAIKRALVVVQKDDRPTMMSNLEGRIAGVEQYARKWTPTFQEWLGDEAGKVYADQYFARVISRLAAEKLLRCRLREALVAIKAIMRHSDSSFHSLMFMVCCISRYCAASILRSARLRSPGRIAGRTESN